MTVTYATRKKVNNQTQESITKDSVVELVREILVDRCEEGIFLLHPEKPSWVFTDQNGLDWLNKFDAKKSVSQIAQQVSEETGFSDQDQIVNDLIQFTNQLRESHLLANFQGPKNPNPVYEEPKRLTIYLTEECNLRCKHCFVVEGKMPSPKITVYQVRKLIDDHLVQYPGALVNFTGGEPFLREDCLNLAIYASQKTDQVSINSNGHLITEEIAAKLKQHKIAIQISLDGPDPEIHDFIRGKGSFEKVRQALKILVDAGHAQRTRISTTLTKCTVDHVKSLVEEAKRLNLYEARFLILNKMKAADTNWGRINPEPDELKEIYRFLLLELPKETKSQTKIQGEFPGFVPDPVPEADHWCPIGKTEIVDSQGALYQCPALLNSEYQVGKIGLDESGEVHKNQLSKRLRETMKRRRFLIPECVECAWQNFCQGGCQAFTQLRTNSIYVNDEFCDFRRELYRKHALTKMNHLENTEDI